MNNIVGTIHRMQLPFDGDKYLLSHTGLVYVFLPASFQNTANCSRNTLCDKPTNFTHFFIAIATRTRYSVFSSHLRTVFYLCRPLELISPHLTLTMSNMFGCIVSGRLVSLRFAPNAIIPWTNSLLHSRHRFRPISSRSAAASF